MGIAVITLKTSLNCTTDFRYNLYFKICIKFETNALALRDMDIVSNHLDQPSYLLPFSPAQNLLDGRESNNQR